MHEHHKEIAILYHSSCPDGFGGAYAAWKKFGDTAEYIPVKYGEDPPQGLDNRDVYIVDFCYESEEVMRNIESGAKRLVVLDHHQSNKPIVEVVREHIFDAQRSGATIAWKYFHPDVPTPRLFEHLQDGDLYHYSLPDTRDIFSYLLSVPYEFSAWDTLVNAIENEPEREKILAIARNYTDYFYALSNLSIGAAKLVRFEGYECYFTSTHQVMSMKSYVGNQLVLKKPPLALVVTAHPDGFGVSIRGDGTVDVSEIAKKYGGGGHPSSSGFFIPNGSEMPWTEIED